MAVLRPYPFAALLRRAFTELERNDAIFDLPRSKFFLGDPDRDLSVRFHGMRASSPLGPAAGPHSQMAQNLVLSWLAGCRILELKTVQVLDELTIPRPCIDMRTVGYNAEWSQELRIQESLEEYVKGAMLIEILRASGELALAPGFEDVIYDMSVGYDLAGIRSVGVRHFLETMMDASRLVERFRAEIPSEYARYRDLEFPAGLSRSITLSTFHGCPPDEIEGIIDHLMKEYGLHCVVKFNPMLLGKEEAHRILHDELGYTDIRVPGSAFTRDTPWEKAVEIMDRLGRTAESLGLGLGAKFSNTLIVRNDAGFLPESEEEVYLSGTPLHVLAVSLVDRFRGEFGDRFPVSFAAGIARHNFPDAVALGLTPITVCSDLLKAEGYGRLIRYYRELGRRMEEVGAGDVESFVHRAYGSEGGDPSAARLRNTEHYLDSLMRDPRYREEKNRKPPPKIGRDLKLFDCITCDKCVPVCPNDANFTLRSDQMQIPMVWLRRRKEGWIWDEAGSLVLEEKHQIANFADFCNDCGNCDVFCPEDGGPYVFKPRFFGSEAAWREDARAPGFFVGRDGGGDLVLGRGEQGEYRLRIAGGRIDLEGDGFRVAFVAEDPAGTVEATGPDDIDLTWYFILEYLRKAVLDPHHVNYVNALVEEKEEPSRP